ncbi:4-hydroxy-tetrahydrodipicolinate synthase [Dyadobacter tibetensis]|uniref:4-hydroxy-tetrahydrodipicolinate synthase n=1 Tax=Dyadobacter tibetensis TaxID=1211851 RepID=UPI0004B3CD42|nr:4-hydroxy-tetrahydrodipicolinate synthase [Dyadobacter tibetensis]
MPLDERFKGVGAALVTPFDEEDAVDYTGLKNLIDLVSEGNVDYLVVQGTTGESPTISEKEKEEILNFTIENNYKSLPIVYGIGGNYTKAVLDTIKKTNFEGVDAILSVCPYYNKPTQEGIIAHFTAIADASPVPVLLYNVPGRTVTNISVPTVVSLSKHPNIIGLKDAGGSLEQSMLLADAVGDEFLLLAGDDNLVTPMISVGWHGVISVIANAFPKEFVELTWQALEGRFKEAAKLQLAFLEFDDLLYVESNPVGIKKCLEIKGICGPKVRLPLLAATPELGEKLAKAMIREGFV